MSILDTMALALRQPAMPCPDGFRTWNGSAPAVRFAVYRNNIQASLIAALEDTFPVTRTVLGECRFRALAHHHALACPPRTPMLVDYGDAFPDFLATQDLAGAAAAAELARFERLYVESFHAADAVPLTAQRLAEDLGDPERLARARLILHPSLRLSRAHHPVAALWGRWQADDGLTADIATLENVPEHAMLLRTGLIVEVTVLSPATACLIEYLHQGLPLGAAANRALDAVPGFQAVEALGLLIRAEAIVDLQFEGDLE